RLMIFPLKRLLFYHQQMVDLKIALILIIWNVILMHVRHLNIKGRHRFKLRRLFIPEQKWKALHKKLFYSLGKNSIVFVIWLFLLGRQMFTMIYCEPFFPTMIYPFLSMKNK